MLERNGECGQGIAVVLVVAIVAAIVSGAIVYLLMPAPGERGALEGEIPIGVIYASTTEAGYFKGAYEIAFEDINNWLEEAEIPIQFKMLAECGEESATKTIEKAETLVVRGCQIILGSNWSSLTLAMKSLADEKKVVIFSPSATSPKLIIPDDYIFRGCPDDRKIALGYKRLIDDLDYEATIIAYAKETFGEGLYEELRKSYEEIGVDIYEAIGFDPEAKDLTAEAGIVNDKYNEAVATYGEGKVFVQCSGTAGVGVPWLTAVGKYPDLRKAPLVGADWGFSTDTIEYAGDVAADGGLISLIIGTVDNPKSEEFKEKHIERYGFEPYCWGYIAYDTTWVAALSILAAEKNDGSIIKKVLPTVFESYYGVAGWSMMTEAGDRASGDYDIAKVALADGEPQWKKIGFYDSATDSIRWEE